MKKIRIELPSSLCRLAGITHGLDLLVAEPVTSKAILDALEHELPMLHGTLRDPATGLRRPFIRFFACEEDLSHYPPDQPVPDAVAAGDEPFLIIGAIAGG